MKDITYLLFHLLTTLAKLIRPGGSRTVIAENLLLKQQLNIQSRSRIPIQPDALDEPVADYPPQPLPPLPPRQVRQLRRGSL